MDKETKIVEIISKLGEMIEDWESIDDEDIQEQAEKLIIATARKLIAVVDEKPVEKKFEMPCNCNKVTKEEIVQAVFDSVKKVVPSDTKVVAFTID